MISIYMVICHQNIKKRIKEHNIDSDLIFCYFRIFRQNVGKILTHYLVKWKLVHSICWLIDCSRRRSAVPSKLETTVLSLGSLSTSRSFCVFKQTNKQKQKTKKITQKSINHCAVLLISLIAHFIKLFWCLRPPCPLSWWKSFFFQSDKKIKTLTDTAELIEDAVHSATVERYHHHNNRQHDNHKHHHQNRQQSSSS